jgi:hypothetical protein
MQQVAILLLVLLGGITLLALFIALTLLFPAPIRRTRRNLETGLGRSLLLGLVNFAFFAVLALVFASIAEDTSGLVAGIFIFLTAIILFALMVLALLGLVAFTNLLGERLGGGGTPFTKNVRGGALLFLAGLAPYVGWFIFTPLIVLTGFGAAILALVRRRREETVVEE